MKVTLDHNCIINLENGTAIGNDVSRIISDPNSQCYVVNIGASEMREKGVRPDRYDKFEELLCSAGIDQLPRLDPMMIFNVTFWGRCAWGSEETIKLSEDIENVLFRNLPQD